MNPFDDQNGNFLVLMNEEGQHSLWPEFIPAPSGWCIVNPVTTRRASLEYIERNWEDIRPASLIEAMEGSSLDK
ncbi:Enterobactin biosynthesis protein YbdZ [Mycobacterium simulans]|uniref:Enterobactin biosynthesis protein YbdZ n=1 Tax=Mycobacterium simulans TaxID=627089 RepID=A0A7Z7IFY7_9MYCO|nr:MbtH family NRPS accessory protein [Mycobacterium simulans]SOJ52757.1 Enterobactin biosynthesis protein YbdZ [Mycobacterium simulans]